jgi:hypothetical protein
MKHSLMGMYILDEDHNPVPAKSSEEWAAWHQTIDNRVVRKHEVCDGEVSVSTVFLGLDHNFNPRSSEPRPILFETVVFGGVMDQHMERCCTWDEAVAQHTRVLDAVWQAHLKAMN